uniref:Uncharacterized protein n=1 Tax=Arundo donax TaxID=35708 RepID=A0A0A9BW02_ARUDO
MYQKRDRQMTVSRHVRNHPKFCRNGLLYRNYKGSFISLRNMVIIFPI